MKKFNLFFVLFFVMSSSSILMAQYTHTDLQNAIDAALPGDIITLNTGTYILGSVVNLNKSNITLKGNSTLFQVSGTGDRLDISADGVTIEDLQIEKTDKTGEQNIIRLRANNIAIKNNTMWGQFVIGDGEVSRAMVFNAGAYTGLQIEGNTIHSFRQPAYISGTNTGNIINNYVYNTKGWVVEGGNLTFTNNTWGVNVYDIAILSTCPSIYYTNIATMSDANNGSVIEDQRISPAVLSVAYVDASTSFSTDLGGTYHPYSTIAPAITRVVEGGKIKVAAGTYTGALSIGKSLTIIGSGPASLPTTIITSPANPIINLTVTGKSYTFQNLIIEGNVTNNGIRAGGSININSLTMLNVIGRNCQVALYLSEYWPGAAPLTTTVNNLSFDNVTLTNNKFIGAYIGKTVLSGIVTNSTITDNGYSDELPSSWQKTGLQFVNFDEASVPHVVVTNSIFSNNGDGASNIERTGLIIYTAYNVLSANEIMTISGCSFSNHPQYAVRIKNGYNVGNAATVNGTFSGNYLDIWFNNIIGSTNSTTLVRNTFDGVKTVGAGPTYDYNTIQGAVSAAVNGDQIIVAAGTYEEQVIVDNKSLSIFGAGNTNTFINSPAVLTTTFSTSYPYKCVVGVVNNGNMTISNLTVNGLGRGNANNRFVGIGFRNSAGTIQNCKILDIRDTPISGVQHGVAVYSYNDDLVSRTINVLNNEISGFQKNAMAMNASNTNPLIVNVQGNTVTGYGATNVTAQNGIQVSGDLVIGLVQQNNISGIGYSGAGYVGTSILNFYADIIISTNTVTDGHVGIYNIDGSATINGNNIIAKKIGNYGYGIVASDPPHALPSPFELPEQTTKLKGIESLVSVLLASNNVSFNGSDNTLTYGIEADAGYGPDDLAIVARNNTVSGFGVGFGVYQCESGCAGGVFTSIDFNNNNILGNTIGFETNLTTPVLAEYNWWGTAVESEIQALINGLVDFDPWLGKGVAVNSSSLLSVNDANSLRGLTNLYFGQNSTATDGIDTHLLEEELPPLPPAGIFDSRFILPAGNIASHRDYRSDTKRFVRWHVQFQGTPPFEFNWDAASLPVGEFYLKDPIDGSFVNINMKNQSSYTLPLSLPLNQMIIENSVYNCYPFDVNTEWNLLSLPLSPSNPLKSILFPTSISDAFGYNGSGYYVANELTAKKAYWLNFSTNQNVVVCGVSVDDIIPVNAGWNMIGVLDEEVPYSRITTEPAGIFAGNFFGYEGGYVIASTLKVGKGYWINCTAAGTIKLHNVLRKEEYSNPIKSDWASITISDAQSKKMDLYLGKDVDTERFDLPPVPPAGAFDVRFANGKMAETLSEEGRIINISTTKYPVSIKVSGINLSVRDLLDGTFLNASISDGGELLISNSRINKILVSGNFVSEKILTYSLDQNFPNPFNPSTTIRFSIPNEGFVNLSVFNILGEKVSELKNEVMKTGNYQLEFDASALASGVYFYKISTGDFVQSKKMLLIK